MKKRYKSLLGISVVVLVLVGLRVYLPFWLRDYTNDLIENLEKYDGQVADVDVHLWRGAYQLEGVELWRADAEFEKPLLDLPLLDLSVDWTALFRGAVVAELDFYEPEINFIDSSGETSDQTGTDANWIELTDELVPFRIDRIGVHDGRLKFHNFLSRPPVEVSLDQFNAEGQNFTNSKDLSGTLVAEISATGRLQNESETLLRLKIDPQQTSNDFDLSFEMQPLALTAIDSLIKAYAPFDAEGGTIALAAEMVAQGGQLEGYIKPGIEDLDVFSWKEDVERDGDNPLSVLWENVVGLVGAIFQNQSTDRIATRIPVSGSIDDPDTNTFSAVINIIRNAFIETIDPSLEDSLQFEDTAENEDSESAPA